MHQPLPVPLYQRVYGVLHQRIQTGVYGRGARLPTEQELTAEFGVSKATIRQAVGELVTRGLVVRQQGRGSYVTETATDDQTAGFTGTLTDLILGTPQLPLADVRVQDGVPFPPSVSARLGTGPTGKVIRTRRTLRGTLFVYGVHYLSPRIAALVSEAELGETGVMALLTRHGIAPRGAEQSISARLADAEVAAELQIGIGAATLMARRVLCAEACEIEVLHSWYRGDLYEWKTELRFKWSGDRMTVSSREAAHLTRP